MSSPNGETEPQQQSQNQQSQNQQPRPVTVQAPDNTMNQQVADTLKSVTDALASMPEKLADAVKEQNPAPPSQQQQPDGPQTQQAQADNSGNAAPAQHIAPQQSQASSAPGRGKVADWWFGRNSR